MSIVDFFGRYKKSLPLVLRQKQSALPQQKAAYKLLYLCEGNDSHALCFMKLTKLFVNLV